MKFKQYVRNARFSLNQWAENTLPGGKMWSTDIMDRESIYLTRRFYPLGSILIPVTTMMTWLDALKLYQRPDFHNIVNYCSSAALMTFAFTIPYSVRAFYDSICREIGQSGLTSAFLKAQGNPKRRAAIYHYAATHDLLNELEIAQFRIDAGDAQAEAR